MKFISSNRVTKPGASPTNPKDRLAERIYRVIEGRVRNGDTNSEIRLELSYAELKVLRQNESEFARAFADASWSYTLRNGTPEDQAKYLHNLQITMPTLTLNAR
jgi:hypothetical protein